MRVAVITPTKDRPEALALCRRWFEQQTHEVAMHIIVDGGSAVQNTMDGMARVPDDIDVVVFADDDDHYKRGWVKWLVEQFENPRILAAGQVVTTMHHIRAERWLRCRCGPLPGTMAVRKSFLPNVVRSLQEHNTPKRAVRMLGAGQLVTTEVGYITHVKGLYQGGQSQKHDPAKFESEDTGLRVLTAKIGGEAVELYRAAIANIDARLEPV